MSMKIEREIVQALKTTLRNSKFRLKDLMEWSSGEIAVDVVIDGFTWHCSVPAATDKRPGTKSKT